MHESAPLRDSWNSRELPLLEAVAAAEQSGADARTEPIAFAAGLSIREAALGLRALYEAGYLTGIDATSHEGPPFDLIEIRLLERGRRAVGQWPSEDLGKLLIAAIEARIASAADTAERSRLERFRNAALGIGRDVLTSLISALARQAAGLP